MKVIHLIPQDGLGGVEQAARSLKFDYDLDVDIEVTFLKGEGLSNNSYIKDFPRVKNLNSIYFYINGFNYLLQQKPDILISSLWRAGIISIAYTLYRKILVRDSFNFVFFVHATKFTHIVDKLTTTFASYLANEIWCDSKATQEAFSKRGNFSTKIKIISFFINAQSNDFRHIYEKKNNFVFWGRLAKVKRLDRAIKLFNKIHQINPKSILYIYGPDDGELENLSNLVQDLRLQEHIIFMGSKEPNIYPEPIMSSKFFINTSSHEGMAIAVTEAMQLGLIPIVTDVGEIANYCTDDVNSIYYNNNVLERVLSTITNETKYKQLSANAFSYWNNRKSYSEDFIANCIRLSSDMSNNK